MYDYFCKTNKSFQQQQKDKIYFQTTTIYLSINKIYAVFSW